MKGNSESRANMGNSESRALYEKYKGMRCWEGGTVIGWCDDPDNMVVKLDKENGWNKENACCSVNIYSNDKLIEGDWYWYVLESHIIK